jgi:hypothetical protein
MLLSHSAAVDSWENHTHKHIFTLARTKIVHEYTEFNSDKYNDIYKNMSWNTSVMTERQNKVI